MENNVMNKSFLSDFKSDFDAVKNTVAQPIE